jgi:hypothetical protein
VDDEHGGLFDDLIFIPTNKHFTNPIQSRHYCQILHELALLGLYGACRLVCFYTSDKSVSQFLYTRRPEVNVVKLILKGLVLVDSNGFLQGALNHSNLTVGLESVHVTFEHSYALPLVDVAAAVVFDFV